VNALRKRLIMLSCPKRVRDEAGNTGLRGQVSKMPQNAAVRRFRRRKRLEKRDQSRHGGSSRLVVLIDTKKGLVVLAEGIEPTAGIETT
jgi:hypothetical protein